jgi:hypothetical protein
MPVVFAALAPPVFLFFDAANNLLTLMLTPKGDMTSRIVVVLALVVG